MQIAEVLGKRGGILLYTRHIKLVTPRLDRAKDEVEAQVGIVLIQAHFKVCRLSVIVKIHCAPFDVKNPVRRAARHRCEYAAAAGKVCATLPDYIGAIIAPVREDGVVKRADIVRRGYAP